MKYLYYEPLGTVYWVENGILYFTPMCKDNTFNTEDGGECEFWEEEHEEHRTKVGQLLGFNQ